MSAANSEIRLNIEKSGSTLVQSLADGDGDVENTGSALVLTECNADEQVWVRFWTSGGTLFGGRLCHLSGVLLHRGL